MASPPRRAAPRGGGGGGTISVDFVDGLRLAGAVPFWFGVALLCLGGDAPTPPLAESTPPPPESTELPPETAEPSFLAAYAPPSVEGPGLRLPEPLTRLYVDGSYARTADLSGLPLIAGSAHNYRFALGGSWAWRRFSFDGEIAFSNITTIDVTMIPGTSAAMPPIDQDKHQTATSLGDTRLGATWTTPLLDSGALVGGFGLRVRLPTHTVIFQFHLADGMTLGKYVFPYYFHVEPTLILGGSSGPFAFVMNQGLVLMAGPGGYLQQIYFAPPSLAFWSAHYALVFAPLRALGLSVDLGTDVQLNHVSAMYFEKLNGLVATTLNVGIQVHVDRYRVDLVGRRELTRDAQVYGVLQYAGTQSVMLRLGTFFN